jgi:hypothetical protein
MTRGSNSRVIASMVDGHRDGRFRGPRRGNEAVVDIQHVEFLSQQSIETGSGNTYASVNEWFAWLKKGMRTPINRTRHAAGDIMITRCRKIAPDNCAPISIKIHPRHPSLPRAVSVGQCVAERQAVHSRSITYIHPPPPLFFQSCFAFS